jgi:UDP-N-acetylglucosamine--N-acetylmuramyl-(pentapeptide) pyrophosphoryl-undecaprenol N-acetylglucosamine transferase
VGECLGELTKHYLVIHQTGPGTDIPPSPGYRPYPYIGAEMPAILASAELVLGRSGAGTVWECAAAGKPMALVPLAGAGTRGDQLENARFFEDAGAALVLGPGPGRNAAALAGMIARLAQDGPARERMAAASAKIGRGCGSASISAKILEAVGHT